MYLTKIDSLIAAVMLAFFCILPPASNSFAENLQTSSQNTSFVIFGNTPLMDAVRAGDSQKISELLTKNVDVNRRNAGGVTALMLAAARGRVDLVNMLLEAGARADINDYDSRSAADRAAENGHDQLALTLKQRAKTIKQKKSADDYDFADDAFVDISHPDWFKHSLFDLRDDVREAAAANKRGLILFLSTRRCSYCKVFLDRVFADPTIKQRLQKEYDVIGMEIFSDLEMFDTDGQRYLVKEFVTKVKAAFTPTLLFYDTNGTRVLRVVGYYPKQKFEHVLDYVAGRHYHDEPLRDYLSRTDEAAPGASSEIIVDRGIFDRPPYVLDRRAAKAKRPLVVVFERENCAACVRFHSRVLNDKTIRRLMQQFEAVQVDISNNGDRVLTPSGGRIGARQWYEQLDLSYTPAIVFFDEAGHEVMRLDSETLRYRLEGTLQLVLEKAYINDAQLQRWRRAKSDEAVSMRK